MIDDIKKSADQKMQKSLEALRIDLGKVRTGRAHTGILDHVQVDYYGSLISIMSHSDMRDGLTHCGYYRKNDGQPGQDARE